ncbi:DUF6291 domain-containing protein [Bacteroides thetaiotaomicron]|uniref:DUF6291 domain-containing protein n=1 Tax=Bacteroides thetaiotaomicron TaxID=818 RepID=UPI0028F4018E|nr:DUF6291 domain-containing protein [Bacteroides thetaiotaomicron]WOG21077.1 DUF6291 domain-containing protein [Bacteroides thetaiotaomicron]
MRDSFVFYRSFFEALQDVPIEERACIYDAICAYSLNDIEPKLTGMQLAIFKLIRPNIDSNKRKYENGKKGASFGKKGGRPKKDNPSQTPTKPQDNPSQTRNVDVDDNVDDDVDDDVDINKEKIEKEKNISLLDRTQKFKDELTPFVEQYGKDMIRAFFDYWSEPNKAKTKMRYEMQKTWDVSGRLRTWERRLNEKR